MCVHMGWFIYIYFLTILWEYLEDMARSDKHPASTQDFLYSSILQ